MSSDGASAKGRTLIKEWQIAQERVQHFEQQLTAWRTEEWRRCADHKTIPIMKGAMAMFENAVPREAAAVLSRFDLVRHLHRQRAFSFKTFGPGTRIKGVLDHIMRELIEIEAAPHDISEWADMILLSLDGAWRQGFSPEQIAAAIEAKQTKNEGRIWPDWRGADPDKAIEHVRGVDIAGDEGGGP